ncbi:MAG: sugar phosphate nucleotidyltransferase [Verrucomicrobiota bacterium]
MKAVILAAGKGKRMRHLTQETPKPMLEIGGKPILEHLICGMRDFAEIRDFFIVTGYLGDQIRRYFENGTSFGVSIEYGIQEVQNGTGKAPEVAKEWVGTSSFLLANGDMKIDPNTFRNVIAQFKEDGFIALKEANELVHGGAVLLNSEEFLEKIVEKAETGSVATSWLNAGLYGLPNQAFSYMEQLELSPRGEYEITDALNAMARDGLKLRGIPLSGMWADVRDPETLAQLNQSGETAD